jgi:adenosylcobinamide-GDP ribazoletransferase
MKRIAGEGAVLLVALGFLTRLPVPARVWSPERMAAIPRQFPLAGLVIGALMAAAWGLASLAFPPVVAALGTVAFGLMLTGALHEDGFADVCDGLGGGRDRDRALEILRDSRIGAYGAMGLGLMLAARVAVLALLPAAAVPAALVAGQGLSRASMAAALIGARYVRAEGAAAPIRSGVDGPSRAVLAAGTLIAAGLAALWLPWPALAAGLAGLVAGHLVMRALYTRRLGGYTGDCLGAVQQCSEIGFLLGLLAWL